MTARTASPVVAVRRSLTLLGLLGCSLIGLLLITGCAATRPKPASPLDVVVESWAALDVAPFNERIGSAVAAGATWPASPLRMTLELFGDDTETAAVRLDERKNRGEGADTTVVTLVRDGFLDDSVRGSWQRIVYHRLADQTWRVAEARRAVRCWRVERLQSYGAKPCP